MDKDIIKAIDNASEWLKYDGVEGIGQGIFEQKQCIIVYCSKKLPENLIPREIDGFPVIIEESGEILQL